MFDDTTGERHVADVKTANGMVIEFQNSPMPPNELRAREGFYGNMIWIVNAAPFRESFSIMSPIPDPNSELGADMVFSAGQRPRNRTVGMRIAPGLTAGLLFWRRSENPQADRSAVLIRGADEVRAEILANYRGHHLFHWARPREVWLDATKPVFFDFGDAAVWWLQVYDAEHKVHAVRRIPKSQLVTKNGGDASSLPPSDGQSPIHEQVDPEAVKALWAKRAR